MLLFQEPTLEQLIQRLASDEIEERNAAGRELRKKGMTAVSLLKIAADAKDVEVMSRARDLLGSILEEFGRSTVRSFEDALDNAPTFCMTCRTVTLKKDLAAPFSVESSLLRRAGGKVRVSSNVQIKNESWNGFLVCDGERMALQTRTPSSGQRDWGMDSRDYWPSVRSAAARVGAVPSVHLWAYARDEEKSVGELLHLGEWQYEDESSATLPALEYSIRWFGRKDLHALIPSRVKVWYDPATLRPSKRLLTYSMGTDHPSVLETFSYDAEIPDSEFKVPEGQQR